MLSRRRFLGAGGVGLAGLLVSEVGRATAPLEIHMKSDLLGTEVWFDPVGLYIDPGQTIRWVIDANVHTTTAYHPANGRHSLRIPEGARPWDSGFLLNPGDHFDLTLTVEGVYDYFCTPHEAAGMVGRLVVGRPGGPGLLPFDYFKRKPGTLDWLPVPEAAKKMFPPVGRIITERRIGKS